MKLTNQALEAIAEKGRIRNLIAAEFDCSEATVRRWAEKNESDNDLTKRKALEIIARETGLTDDQILTQEPAKA